MDLNNVRRKPVSIQVKRKATEDDGQSDECPLFRRHERKELTVRRAKIFEGATEVLEICPGGARRRQWRGWWRPSEFRNRIIGTV